MTIVVVETKTVLLARVRLFTFVMKGLVFLKGILRNKLPLLKVWKA